MAKYYINCDQLVEWLKRIPLKDLSGGLGLCRVIMVEDFKRAIRTIPEGAIIDAVPVVRCKDCESARELTQHESIYLADGVLICTNCEVSEDCRLPVWPQHFCGYGRKKDGGEADVVETVPVVRCENCLYWVSGKNECESWEWCKMLNTDMPPNGFCYLGDRKDEARNER